MADADRDRALEWAGLARLARYKLRDRLHGGELSLEEALHVARTDPLTGRVKLLWTLESLPGAGKVETRRKLASLGLAESARIGALSDAHQALVLANFGAGDR